jgi:hypothetical protein
MTNDEGMTEQEEGLMLIIVIESEVRSAVGRIRLTAAGKLCRRSEVRGQRSLIRLIRAFSETVDGAEAGQDQNRA